MFTPLVLLHLSTQHQKSNSLFCLTFIVTESGFHPIPSLVHETATETEFYGLRQRQDGNGSGITAT